MFLNPEKIIENLNIEPGMNVADFGAGPGYYTLALAKIVNPGIVYAIDIRKEALNIIRSRAKINNIQNIETLWADLEIPGSANLKDESVGFVIISNILFQVENKNALLKEAFRILKPDGYAAAIEWEPGSSKVGPSPESRLSKAETKKLFEEEGFLFAKEFSAGDKHYGLVFKKVKTPK